MFFTFSFSSFLIFFAAAVIIDVLLPVKISENPTGNFYHRVAKCGGRKFCQVFHSNL